MLAGTETDRWLLCRTRIVGIGALAKNLIIGRQDSVLC